MPGPGVRFEAATRHRLLCLDLSDCRGEGVCTPTSSEVVVGGSDGGRRVSCLVALAHSESHLSWHATRPRQLRWGPASSSVRARQGKGRSFDIGQGS